jgi:hypothetical protein
MIRERQHLTNKEEEFCKLIAEEGLTFVAAYRIAYPARQEGRSREAERVAGKRVAHRPRVQARIEQLRAALHAADPAEMRLRANAVLSEILAKRLDPRYRRTAIDVLKRLDDQERATAKAEWETYRKLTKRTEALDAMDGDTTRRDRSASAQASAEEKPQIDLDRIVDEIDQMIAAQRQNREVDVVAMQLRAASPDDPPQAPNDGMPCEKETPVAQTVVRPADGFKLVRKPGYFGKGSWVRVPAQAE